MNHNTTQNPAQGNWQEIKGKIKSKFGKFTDDELESFNGNLDKIAVKIQKTYGYSQERAEREYQDLKATFGSNFMQKDSAAANARPLENGRSSAVPETKLKPSVNKFDA
jgi:uncharacterized protein YjbJ (UPF0337 family)